MPGEGGREPRLGGVARDGGLLRASQPAPEAVSGVWVQEELQAALLRVEVLTREVRQLEGALRSQQDEVARLANSMQVVEGRTVRHEAGAEQQREVRHEVADLEERLAQEVSLRRDLAGQVERAQRREAETQHELQRVLQLISDRLDEFDRKVEAEASRQAVAREAPSAGAPDEAGLLARVEQLERRLGAESEGARHQGAEIARLASAVTQLVTALDAIEARAEAGREDQRRLDEQVASLRSVRGHEDALRELVEQQRATRARLEDRVNQVEEALEALRQAQAAGVDERALLSRQVAGEAEQRRALAERLEAQRDSFLEHIHRQARADEEARRRMIEEWERDIRVQRSLLVRLAEQTEEGEQEQPL